MKNEIILLGTKGGPALRQKGASPTASILRLNGRTIMIDCAIASTKAAVDAGVSLLDINDIFITHLHSDHVLELGPLIYTAWTTGLQTPVNIYGPTGIQSYWDGFLASMSYDYSIRIADEGRPPLKELIHIHTYGEGPIDTDPSITVNALRVEHPPITDCFALRFNAAGKTVVFSADTCYFPPLAEFAKHADVLIHEAMLRDGVENLIKRTPGAPRLRQHLFASHTLADQVGQIATDAGVKHLILNHLVPADDPNITDADWQRDIRKTWDGLLTVGHDGLRIDIP